MIGLGHLSEICFHGSGGLQDVIKVTKCRIFSLKQEIKCKKPVAKVIYFKLLYFFWFGFFSSCGFVKKLRAKMFYFNSGVFQNNL